MPVRRSRQGSNSATAKLITRANSSKLHLINNNNNSGDGLTAKQQQQIERNEYLEKLTKDQLKFECRKRGQKSSGTKVELLQRLGYKMPLQQLNKVVDATTSNNTNNINNKDLTKSSSNGTLSNSTRLTDKQREKLKMERKNLTLWKHPITTLKYFGLESYILLSLFGRKLTNNKPVIAFLATLCSILTVFLYIPGRHQFYFDLFRNNTFFVVYWVGLGVLSSVGLGTGLHTFILYLGPHIASVTLAAYECNSLDFPKPPYPNEIICPEHTNPNFIPSLWSIMTKVRFEAFLWGAGTALGELPPYFMARAARLSGHDQDEDEDMKEFEELQQKKAKGVKLNLFDRAKLAMERIVEKVGFLGILACASIPNPLFDLAGITCGHFLVPFWTFFGATLIGKAVIKMHIQKIFVIIAFNELLIDKAVDFLELVPIIGKKLQEPFKSFLQNQKIKLHGRNKVPSESGNMLQKIFETFVVLMVAYFLLSIVNSFAQSYHKRLHKKSQKKIGKEKDN